MRPKLIPLACVLAATTLAGCDFAKPAAKQAGLSGSGKVEAIASTLQACSYEGKPVAADAGALTGPAPADCTTAVNRIMQYTGLPANFTLVAGPVDNAAAAILLDANRVPRRVIAVNPRFMTLAAQEVNGDAWGPISIMAHEIAHHLSGHTITAGGSRPEIELEADKFSGFVLYKMGAPLADATRMVLTVGSPHATATHPDKMSRAEAIRQGWTQSCQQAGGSDCAGGAAAQPQPVPGPGPQPTLVPAVVRVLPQPGSVPFKYGHFVIDETGKLDPARTAAMEQRLYLLARDVGAEFSVLVVNDLRGLSAQDFAWAMMRQLRVGKLDVGNGAVVVVAPRQHQAAVAFGPGFAKEAEFSHPERQLLQWIDAGWGYCDDADGCKSWTDNLFDIFSFTLNNVAHTKWTIQYQTLGDLLSHYEAMSTDRARTGRPFDADRDQPLGNLLRVSGRVTSLNPPTSFGAADPHVLGGTLGYTAVSLTTDDGLPVILYVSPRLAGLMPSGRLRDGVRYTVVGRMQKTGDRRTQASAMWLFSYDPI